MIFERTWEKGANKGKRIKKVKEGVELGFKSYVEDGNSGVIPWHEEGEEVRIEIDG